MATFNIAKNHSTATPLRFFIQGSDVQATTIQQPHPAIRLQNLSKSKNTITVTALDASRRITKKVKLSQKPLTLSLINGQLL